MLRANGKVIIDLTGSELKKINAYRGIVSSSGFLTLDFTENAGRQIEGAAPYKPR